MASKSVTVTAKKPTDAQVARQITGAYAALANLNPTPARIRAAASKVLALRATMSIRGIVAAMSVEGNGTLPTGKGTIERLGYVADALTGEWNAGILTGSDADGIVASLYRIAQIGRAADVARAAEMGRKCPDAESAFTAVDAVREELNAAQHKSLTAAPARPVAGEAADGGKSPAQGPQAPAQDDGDTTTGQNALRLSDVGTGALIAELTRRYSGKRASVLSADADALAALTATVEALVTAGRVAKSSR